MSLVWDNAELPSLRPTGYMPSFLQEMVEKGHLDLSNWFQQVSRGGTS
jgi:hypothetical protein